MSKIMKRAYRSGNSETETPEKVARPSNTLEKVAIVPATVPNPPETKAVIDTAENILSLE